MAKSTGSNPSRLAAEERQLEQQREELLRRAQELERKLKLLPTVMEAQEEQKRELAKHRAASAGRAISPYAMGGSGRRTRAAKSLHTPSRQRFAAQLKTAALLIALVIIFLLLWRVVPST